MSEASRLERVIKKYRLNAEVSIAFEVNGRPSGRGPLLSKETLANFTEGDPSGNLKYLDWMLFMAGGGETVMRRSLDLWTGASDADSASLRNQCRVDFVQSRMAGEDDEGRSIPRMTRAEADKAWIEREPTAKYEFIMGDEDIAREEGYGFYRNWPGPDGLYQKIVDAVQLWHGMQNKLADQNRKIASMDKKLLAGDNSPKPVVLDIYAGWKPDSYSQAGATYPTLQALHRALAGVRKFQVLKDIQYDLIYEDDRVRVLCPFTIGASIAFGINKWCVCNMSEFDRAFQVGGDQHANWQTYSGKGPLVFFNWKGPMPEYLHKLALHLDAPSHRKSFLPDAAPWFDCNNAPGGIKYKDIVERITSEHAKAKPEHRRVQRLTDEQGNAIPTLVDVKASDYEKWGGRTPGAAWRTPEDGAIVAGSLAAAVKAIRKWAPGFDTSKIQLNFATGKGKTAASMTTVDDEGDPVVTEDEGR